MLKNKIYKYLSGEIFKNFITILLTFTAIAWVVRAVNFLDLMVEDGFNTTIYFKYAALNITSIITRFVPLAFLISLTVSILKFERQQELLILWTSGLNKIKITNIFLLIALFITSFQIIMSLFVNPLLLNKSRALLGDANYKIYPLLRSNDFSDAFKGITFYIDKKNINNELENIFIKDVGGSLNYIVGEKEKKNVTIIAKKGFAAKDKLILFNGTMQTLNLKNEIKNIKFEKTEVIIADMTTRTILQPKIQETSSLILLKCIFNKNKNLKIENCSTDNYKGEVMQTLSRRSGSPLYIPLIAVLVSFLLIHKKKKKYNFLKKYVLFILTFIILILSEILLKYTGLFLLATISYYVFPIIVSIFFYIYLIKKITTEKII
jgi:lipopolysaccharide export system permease protein